VLVLGHLQATQHPNMAKANIAALLLLLLHLTSGQLASFDQLRKAIQESQETQEEREERSLANTFPFNQGSHEHQHHRDEAPQARTQIAAVPKRAVRRIRMPANSQNLGFSLFPGFEARSGSRNQNQIGPLDPTNYQEGSYDNEYASSPVIPAFMNFAKGGGSAAFQHLPAPIHQDIAHSLSSAVFSPSSVPAPPLAPAPPQFFVSSPVLGPNSVTASIPAPSPISNTQNRVVAARKRVKIRQPINGRSGAGTSSQIPARRVPLRRIPSKRIPARNPLQARQGQDGTSFEDVAAAGKRCIDKIETVEEIEYDEVEECNHSYDRKCHTTYITEFESQQEEECDDNYKKSCKISYSTQAQNTTVEICTRPLVKDCNLSGPETCRTEYVTECWTRNDPHLVEDDVPQCVTVKEEKCEEIQSGYTTEEKCKTWPREVCTIQRERKEKYNPVTKCEKVPQELCGPSGCGFVEGPEVCQDEVRTVVTEVPEEVCDLQPRRSCEHITKLVPKLTPKEECEDVPKEVCTKSKANPRTVQKPVTKQWCYTPTQESGLA